MRGGGGGVGRLCGRFCITTGFGTSNSRPIHTHYRPLKIGDNVVLGGDEGIVEDVSTLFTTIVKPDGVKVLIPNNSILGAKVYIKPAS